MSSEKINIEEIQQLLGIVENYGLEELSVTEGDLSVTIKSPVETSFVEVSANTLTSPRPVTSRKQPGVKPGKGTSKPEPRLKTIPVISPMTGVFYRSPSPDSPVFVDIGDHVSIGQVVGLIEAMKVFSEIPSEVSGRVVQIPAVNGQLVQSDEPIILLEPDQNVEE